MVQRGGKRPGAGRKIGSKSKKTIEQEKALEILREEIRKQWIPLLETKIQLAQGIYVEKKIPMGKNKMKVIIYKKQPDSDSLEWLLEMVVGKPTQPIEHGVGEKSLLELEKIFRQIAEMPKKKNE